MTNDPTIYHWESEALENYMPGDIFAVGRDIHEARINAWVSIEKWLAQDAEDGSEPDEIAKLRAEFESDTAGDPTLAKSFIVSGPD